VSTYVWILWIAFAFMWGWIFGLGDARRIIKAVAREKGIEL
jgi:uncharacterized protein YneF (UPF0154 family)